MSWKEPCFSTPVITEQRSDKLVASFADADKRLSPLCHANNNDYYLPLLVPTVILNKPLIFTHGKTTGFEIRLPFTSFPIFELMSILEELKFVFITLKEHVGFDENALNDISYSR